MSWRARLVAASFRGVPFEVESSSRTGGRMLQEFKFDRVDAPEVDDHGRRVRPIVIDAYLHGDDIIDQKHALEEALDAPGAGTLVHPSRGTLQARCETFDCTESFDAGGNVAHFTITFWPAEGFDRPLIELDALSGIETSAASLLAAALAAFEALFDVAGNVAYVRSAVRDVRSVTAAIRRAVTAPAELVTATTAAVDDALSRIEEDIDAIVSAPEELGAALVAAVALLADPFGLASLGASTGITALETESGPTLDPTEEANRQCFDRFVGNVVLSRLCAVGASTSFETYDDAIAWRDRLTPVFVDLARGTDADTYAAQLELRGLVMADLMRRAALLPRVVQVTPTRVVPALVLAHEVYGDARRTEEMLRRGGLFDPSAVRPEPILMVSP